MLSHCHLIAENTSVSYNLAVRMKWEHLIRDSLPYDKCLISITQNACVLKQFRLYCSIASMVETYYMLLNFDKVLSN